MRTAVDFHIKSDSESLANPPQLKSLKRRAGNDCSGSWSCSPAFWSCEQPASNILWLGAKSPTKAYKF